MRIEEAVKNDSVICTEEMPLNKVFNLMLERNCDCVAVVESFAHKVPLGLITERDICLQLIKKNRDPRWLTAANVMNSNVSRFKKTSNLEKCLSSMQKQKTDHSFVIDNNGMFCGMIDRKELEAFEKRSETAQSIYETKKRRSFRKSSDTIF